MHFFADENPLFALTPEPTNQPLRNSYVIIVSVLASLRVARRLSLRHRRREQQALKRTRESVEHQGMIYALCTRVWRYNFADENPLFALTPEPTNQTLRNSYVIIVSVLASLRVARRLSLRHRRREQQALKHTRESVEHQGMIYALCTRVWRYNFA